MDFFEKDVAGIVYMRQDYCMDVDFFGVIDGYIVSISWCSAGVFING
jgi:hypothetical protein